MPNRNGRTVAGWIVLGLMLAGILVGVVLYGANNQHAAAQAQTTADNAHGRIDRLEPTVQAIDRKVARILGILEGKSPSE